VVLFGSTLPWSKIVADYVHHTGNGTSTVLGSAFRRASAPGAAFANGAFAHSFEFDNLRQPSTGVHPGATVLTGALATAEEANVSGKDLITAFVAGVECMFRIAAAAESTGEKLGFHAPGFTGVFGSTIAANTEKPPSAHVRYRVNRAAKTAKSTTIGAKVEATASEQPVETSDPVIIRAMTTIAAKLEEPASAEFGEMKRAIRKNTFGQPIDTICGSVKGKSASGEDTGERPFL